MRNYDLSPLLHSASLPISFFMVEVEEASSQGVKQNTILEPWRKYLFPFPESCARPGTYVALF